MISVFTTTFFYYVRAVFTYLFSTEKKQAPPLWYAGKCLLKNTSYRLTEQQEKDPFLLLKLLFYSLRETLGKRYTVEQLRKSSVAYYDIKKFPDFKEVINYLEQMSGKEIGYFIDRNRLKSQGSFLNRGATALFQISLCMLLFIPTLIIRKRANWVLLPFEMAETAGLLYALKKLHVTELYELSIIEIDSNITAYILMKNHIKVHKVPASNPLSFSNKEIIAYELLYTIPYQEDEARFLKDSMFIKESQHWAPFSSMSYLPTYANKTFDVNNKIGFISSAGYARKYKQDANPELLYRVEDNLLKSLATYLQHHPELELVIFLHPVEKKDPALLSKVQEYYRSIFHELPFQYAPLSEKTVLLFDRVNITVSAYSTASFERLFCGFKSLFYCEDFEEFPIPLSPLNNICAKSKEEMMRLLDENILVSHEAFFIKNKMENYVYQYYTIPQPSIV